MDLSLNHFVDRPLRPLICGAVVVACCAALSGQSSFKRWGTTYETQFGLGYDSNVYGTRDTFLNDGFWNASQSVKVERRNSLTRFDVVGTIERTDYFSETDADYTDGSLEIVAAYPNDRVDVTFWNASLFYNERTRLNLDAGQRVQPTVYGARFGGEWKLSPKTGFVGSLATTTNDLTSQGFAKTSSVKARAGVSREWGPESRWSLEYRFSRSEAESGLESESTHHHFGVSGWGVLRPKVRGTVFLGVRKSAFSGFYDFSDSGPNVSADLTWAATQQFTAQIGIENDYEFTANGNVQLLTTANLRLRRDLGKGFRASALVERALGDYELSDGADGIEEDVWRLGAELEYAFTKRFFARMSVNSLNSNSSLAGRDTKRTLYQLSGGLRY